MAVERKGSYSLVPLLTSAGLISGLITAALDYPAGKLGEYVLGGVFGTIIAVALAVGGLLPKFWRAILLPVAAAVVFYLSWYSAGIVELGLASGNSSMGQPFNVSPIAMFVGGVVGGFGVLGVILALVQPQEGMRTHAINAVSWSLMGGILAVVGWLLGLSLIHI